MVQKVKSACNVGEPGSTSGSGRSPGEGDGNQLLYFLPGGSHGQRSLAGYSPWGHTESDPTEATSLHFTSSLIKSHLYMFVSVFITQRDGSKKNLCYHLSQSVLPTVSSKSFIVSGLTFRYLICFECIFLCVVLG